MTGNWYAVWRNRWPYVHSVVSVAAVAVSSLFCAVRDAGADTGDAVEPISKKLYDHPLLFLCIILLLSALIVVLLLSRRKLLTSERRYRSLFSDNAAIMLLIEPVSMRIMDANPAAFAFYGWSPADFLDLRITDINTLPESEVREIFHDVLDHEKRRFTARHRLASGEERDVEVNSMPYRLEGRECLLSIIHDITVRTAT